MGLLRASGWHGACPAAARTGCPLWWWLLLGFDLTFWDHRPYGDFFIKKRVNECSFKVVNQAAWLELKPHLAVIVLLISKDAAVF